MNDVTRALAKGLAKGWLLGLVIAIVLSRKLQASPVAQALYFGTLMMVTGMIIGWHMRKLFERK